jgi:hypothetical protein
MTKRPPDGGSLLINHNPNRFESLLQVFVGCVGRQLSSVMLALVAVIQCVQGLERKRLLSRDRRRVKGYPPQGRG